MSDATVVSELRRYVTAALTIRHAQQTQPWKVPYAKGVLYSKEKDVPHILATHNTLHAAKSVGKLAAVFEEMDHPLNDSGYGPSKPTDAQLATIKAMSADLMTGALRFANLFEFDLSDALEARVMEKNGIGFEDLQIEVLDGKAHAACCAYHQGLQDRVDKLYHEVVDAKKKHAAAYDRAEHWRQANVKLYSILSDLRMRCDVGMSTNASGEG